MLFGEYHFYCRFETDAVLPRYKGSTFRGVFGHALKQVVCALKRQTCETCLLKQSCVYALVFETEVAGALPAVSRMAAPPHPFVIEPPLGTRTGYPAGSDFNFTLLLFGDVNPSFLSRSVMENIVAFVEQRGGGIVFMAGPRFTPLAYRDTPLATLMPVDLDTASAPPLTALTRIVKNLLVVVMNFSHFLIESL